MSTVEYLDELARRARREEDVKKKLLAARKAEDPLDVFTHNKTIQKIRESYRVPAIDKERLKQLKR